ncbi:MAG: hypothetical protein IID28_12145 [Planctomycetes bacterium]|nr:hypothetical protein [Planctomycetota bacterium]
MGFLADLWMPIVFSSGIVFVLSALAWMVSPHHKADWKGIPNEDGFLDALRAANTPSGQYMFPYCDDPKSMKDPEKKKKWEAGPHGAMFLRAAAPNMGKNLLFTFIFYLVVGVFVAYIGHVALDDNPEYLQVFQVTGCAAVMAYCFGMIPGSIWFGKSARSTVMDILDGVVYALFTAGTFGWLWPTAVGA